MRTPFKGNNFIRGPDSSRERLQDLQPRNQQTDLTSKGRRLCRCSCSATVSPVQAQRNSCIACPWKSLQLYSTLHTWIFPLTTPNFIRKNQPSLANIWRWKIQGTSINGVSRPISPPGHRPFDWSTLGRGRADMRWSNHLNFRGRRKKTH